MSGYGDFACYYDALTRNADYEKRAALIASLLKKYGRERGILLDAACGTGTMSELFAAMGYEVIGVDASAEMLSEAMNKRFSSGSGILYLNQDLRALDLYGTIQCAVCCLDSLNHMPDEKGLREAIRSVGFFMEKDGVFVFDVNTEYKHERVLGDNAFVYETDEVLCVWRNAWDPAEKRTDIHLDFFEPREDGAYERAQEDFSERFYSDATLRACLSSADFRVEEVLGEDGNAPREDEERMYYVCRKLKDQ
ncbi:MAG: class I SAM-dependent methyltransferase [Clostridia bacterium]|nr:class I SAM-dependent methyltransferase [Clostridia bacterium]